MINRLIPKQRNKSPPADLHGAPQGKAFDRFTF